MPHVEGVSRDTLYLMPPSLDDYISADNPVRFLDAFVDQLDLSELGFARVAAAQTGRPAYHPADLLKLYLYGYLNRVRSSRLLEREAQRNIELIWLLRQLAPDHKTIADFRKNHLAPIRAVCRSFTVLCRELGLFGGELVAIDGSKFKAWNNRKRNWNASKLQQALAAIDSKIDEYLSHLDVEDCDGQTSRPLSPEQLEQRLAQLRERKDQYQLLQAELEASGERQLSQTDPDSRMMATGQGVDVCYNVQLATDSKHKLIVAEDVVNEVTDHHQLAPLACAAKAALAVEQLDVVADTGYVDSHQVKQCDEAQIRAFVPKPHTSRNQVKGLFTKQDFHYHQEHDHYMCPQGEVLQFRFETVEKGRPTRYYTTSSCRSCPLKVQCTKRQEGRRITRHADEYVLDTMATRVAARPDILKRRKAIIEHVFGTIKRSMNQGYMLLKTLPKVRTELSLSVLAYNIKRVITIVGVPALLEALHKHATSSQKAPITGSNTVFWAERAAILIRFVCCYLFLPYFALTYWSFHTL